MLTKDETAKYLRGIGYDAESLGDKVIIWCDEPMRRGKKEQVRNRLMSIGYKGTWGWRIKKTSRP